jgi:2-dehydro-3-deoxyphosphooctonate aldolase (KDO 8-P synthase)
MWIMTKFTIIAGPCLIESGDLTLGVANKLSDIRRRLMDRYYQFGFDLIFKASFDKANRTSNDSARGMGISLGLDILNQVKSNYHLPILTDIHESFQADLVKEIVDVIQIPALLCRQTDLLVAAARTGRIVNIKKGQFMAPWDMKYAVDKVHKAGGKEVWLTERGTTFGYGRLVNDMTAIPIMRQFAPVIFDATHSVQTPGSLGDKSGGQREMVETLARAAVAAGCQGLFFETHPDPGNAPSDGPNMIPLDQMEDLLLRLLRLRATVETL